MIVRIYKFRSFTIFSSKEVRGSYIDSYTISLPTLIYDDFATLQIVLNEDGLAEELRHRVQYPEYVARMLIYSVKMDVREPQFFLRYYRMTFTNPVPCYSCNREVHKLHGATPFTQVCYSCLKAVYDEYTEESGEPNLRDPTVPSTIKAMRNSLDRNEYIDIHPPDTQEYD